MKPTNLHGIPIQKKLMALALLGTFLPWTSSIHGAMPEHGSLKVGRVSRLEVFAFSFIMKLPPQIQAEVFNAIPTASPLNGEFKEKLEAVSRWKQVTYNPDTSVSVRTAKLVTLAALVHSCPSAAIADEQLRPEFRDQIKTQFFGIVADWPDPPANKVGSVYNSRFWENLEPDISKAIFLYINNCLSGDALCAIRHFGNAYDGRMAGQGR